MIILLNCNRLNRALKLNATIEMKLYNPLILQIISESRLGKFSSESCLAQYLVHKQGYSDPGLDLFIDSFGVP